MADRVAHGHFETFARARLEFVRNIASLSERPEYLESLLDEDAFGMLRGLLNDKVPTVQQTAALAVGRMAGFSTELSEELVKSGILEQLTASMRGSTAGHMKAGAFVIRSVAKHSEDLCQYCVEAGCCETLTLCMEQLDTSVREAAAQSLATMALHSGAQAAKVVASGALPLLVAAMQEPEPALKKAAAACIGEVAKHSPELSQAVVQAGGLPALTALMRHGEAKVRRQVCNSLAQIVKHTPSLAEAAVDARAFPVTLVCMQDADAGVRRNAAVCMREIVKHSEQLASVVVECGGVGSAIEYITSRARGADRLAAVMSLGFISAYGEGLAQRVIDAAGVPALKDVMLEEKEDHIRAASVWAVGQTGRHSPSHARALAEADVLRHVLDAHLADESSDDLREKSKRCLKAVIAQCDHVMALQRCVRAEGRARPRATARASVCAHFLLATPPLTALPLPRAPARSLLAAAPGNIAKAILRQVTAVLRNDNEQRKQFLASGGLKLVQTLVISAGGPTGHGAGRPTPAAASDPELVELVSDVNMCYPAEVVSYCRPDYLHRLSDRIRAEVKEESAAERKAWITDLASK